MKTSGKTYTLDLNLLIRFIFSYNREQRLILVQDFDYEYNYKTIDMLFEPIERYVYYIHDIVEYRRSPASYHAKILRQALDKYDIDSLEIK